MMNISISNSSDLPLYRQLYDQIAGSIIRGELSGGSPLPPIRTVSAELKISVISIKRAWEELERDGFIDTAVGRGCFVKQLSTEEIKTLREKMLKERLKGDVSYAKSLGISLKDFQSIIKRIY